MTFASPDTPGMPAPSELTAWDFMPDGWTLKPGFQCRHESHEAWIAPADFTPITQLEHARVGVTTPQMRRVAAKLVLGGWPLAGDEDDDDTPPKEGSALARIVAWLREGYPGGVPEHDYMPLIALLERRLTRSEVKKIAKALRRADVSPAGPSDIAAAITEYTHTQPSENDLRRVRYQLARKGWPVEFPDPDLD